MTADTYKVTAHFESDADKETFLKLIEKWEYGLLGDEVDEPESTFSVTTEAITTLNITMKGVNNLNP